MAPGTPGRHRGPRPQVNNNIGEAGRTTNIAPPKGVPRDSAGHERPDAFFNRADAGSDYDDEADYAEDQYDDEAYAERSVAAVARQQSAKKKVVNGQQRGARAERPDRYLIGEDRGRKTGVVKAVSRRDAEGFEDPDAFFQSSPARSVATATTARSTIKKSVANGRLFHNGSPSGRDDEYGYDDQDESDMAIDDDTGLSPLTYQRQHPSTTGSAARRPSALRHSTTASGSRTVSRKGLSSPRENGAGSSSRRRLSSLEGDEEEVLEEEEDDEVREYDYEQDAGGAYGDQDEEEDEDEDEDEVVRAALGAKKPLTGAVSSAARGKGKARASYGSPDSAAESPSGLMKLDRNGRPVPVVDRKGKGRAIERSPSPVDMQPEHEEYYQPEFGGGGDEYSDDGVAGAGDNFQFDDDADAGAYGYDDDGAAGADGDEQDEEDDSPPVAGPSSRPMKGKPAASKGAKGKGKGKARARSSTSPGKKGVSSASQKGPSRKGAGLQRPREVIIDMSRKREREEGTVEIDGLRRSMREKIPRLETWRNERIIYKRRASGIGLGGIVRVPKVEPAPLSKAGVKKGRSASVRATSRAATVKREEAPEEEGCDDMTDPDGLVWSWEGNAEVSRRVAFTARMMSPKKTFDGKFSYQKIYQELDYLAGGILTLPPDGEKSLKSSKDNSYIFFCTQGSVSVTVHRTVFTIGPGGTFFVPRGNAYRIQATSNREVKLFFAQGRRVIEYDDGSTRADTKEDSQRYVQEEQLAAVEEEDEEDE
ncbi:Mif2p [Rhodotorula paludigena]|uniref:Mif2p n=1 Tax=Rhodotorula paludigena TaxID=86838 RepID=UPI003178CEDA